MSVEDLAAHCSSFVEPIRALPADWKKTRWIARQVCAPAICCSYSPKVWEIFAMDSFPLPDCHGNVVTLVALSHDLL